MSAALDPMAEAVAPPCRHRLRRRDARTAWFLLRGLRNALATGDLALAELLIGTLALAVRAFEPIVARRVAADLVGLRGALAVARACLPGAPA